jgi:hypothetical protein
MSTVILNPSINKALNHIIMILLTTGSVWISTWIFCTLKQFGITLNKSLQDTLGFLILLQSSLALAW